MGSLLLPLVTVSAVIVDASGGDLGLDVWLVCLAAAGAAGLALFLALRTYVSAQVTRPVVELT